MGVSQGKDFPGPRFLGAGLPGQAWGLQSWYSAASPTQGRPPLRGSGLVHVLLRTRKPSSQSREQDDQALQAAQPPLTVSGDVPPPRRRSSTRAERGETGLSDKGFFKATLSPTFSPHTWPPRACYIALGLAGGWRRWWEGLGLYRPCRRLLSHPLGRFGSQSSFCQTAGREGPAGVRGT